MLEDLEDLADIRAYDELKAKPSEFIPAGMVEALLGGANRIRVWREHRGLTQQALANAGGLDPARLAELERDGDPTASAEELRTLAAALGIDAEDLLPPTPDQDPESDVTLSIACGAAA